MTKSELLSTYTAEQLASMVINLQSASEVKNDEIHKLKWQISSLEEESGRLQAKVDTYNKYLLPRCTKKARRMIDENRFSEVRIATWDEWNNRGKDAMNISDIQKCQEEYEKLLKESPIQGIVDGIARDILEQKNNAMAMEFTKAICGLLEKYGVRINCTETKRQNITHNLIEEEYGIIFDSVDFSRHDKEFKDKIEELKKQLDRSQTTINQIDEILKDLFGATFEICETKEDFDGYKRFLEKNIKAAAISDFLPTEPIKVADMLINATYTRQKGSMEKALHKAFGNNSDTVIENVYSESELRQIAEHLLVYCGYSEGDGE